MSNPDQGGYYCSRCQRYVEPGESRLTRSFQSTLDNRQPNRVGLVLHHTPGHGGDVWTVLHGEVEDGVFIPNWYSDTKSIAVYLYSELLVPVKESVDV